MVTHDIAPQQMHELIKHICTELLKKAIRITIVPDPVYDFTAFLIAFYKLVQRFYVLLQISVYGNHHVGMLPCSHHTCKNGALMTIISGEAKPGKNSVFFT